MLEGALFCRGDKSVDLQNLGILLVAHGTRDPQGALEFRRFARQLESYLECAVAPSFLEWADPPAAQGVRQLVGRGVRRILIQPLFLGPASHQKNDLPVLVQWASRQWPELKWIYGIPLGIHAQLVETLAHRTHQCLEDASPGWSAQETGILLVGRGSRDPDSNAHLFQVARLLWEGRKYLWVEGAFYSLTEPRVPEGLDRLVRLGARQIVVTPYFLFWGVLLARIHRQVEDARRRYPDVCFRIAHHLGADWRIFEVIRQRVQEALEGAAQVNCDICKYRYRWEGFEAEWGLPQHTDEAHGLRGVNEGTHAHGILGGHAHLLPHGHSHPPVHDASHKHAATDFFRIEEGEEITRLSFFRLRQELESRGLSLDPRCRPLVERVLYATADLDFVNRLRFHPEAIPAGVKALQNGAWVVCDVHMVRVGVDQTRLRRLGGQVVCGLPEASPGAGQTRTAAGIQNLAQQGRLDGNIVVIGNAPTALLELLDQMERGIRPALVIGVPVGFVQAEESKRALMACSRVPWIATRGQKGGCAVAVALINALIRMACPDVR